MRQFKVLVLLAFAASLSGCETPTTYTKSVVVTKDGAGKVLQIVETEAVVQPGGYGNPVRFEHLLGVKPPPSQEQVESTQGGYEFRKNK
jgi:hypothetical protein